MSDSEPSANAGGEKKTEVSDFDLYRNMMKESDPIGLRAIIDGNVVEIGLGVVVAGDKRSVDWDAGDGKTIVCAVRRVVTWREYASDSHLPPSAVIGFSSAESKFYQFDDNFRRQSRKDPFTVDSVELCSYGELQSAVPSLSDTDYFRLLDSD